MADASINAILVDYSPCSREAEALRFESRYDFGRFVTTHETDLQIAIRQNQLNLSPNSGLNVGLNYGVASASSKEVDDGSLFPQIDHY